MLGAVQVASSSILINILAYSDNNVQERLRHKGFADNSPMKKLGLINCKKLGITSEKEQGSIAYDSVTNRHVCMSPALEKHLLLL
jgi:hypothetical protein